MVYPDGEELCYTYNTGGLLRSMSGKRLGHRYNYLTRLGYDKFENRVYLSYGNGTETTYDYEQDRRRLSHITATTSNGRKMMDNTYSYDKVNNILSLVNEAPQVSPNKKGGPFEYAYQYDDLYRLTHAEGDWKGATHEQRYELDMQYSPTGSILHKTQTHDCMSYDEPGTWVPQHKTTYDWEYKYEGTKPHAPSQIGENVYSYDANGNTTGWQSTKNNQRRNILWDEENRIRAIAENGTTHHYIYDASGERVIKATGDGQAIYINGFPMGGSGTVGNYTMYVNPFMVVSNSKYTKHFYIEGQRIVSKLGEMGEEQDLLKPKFHAGDSTNNPVKWDNKKEFTKDIIIANFEALGLEGAVFTTGKSGKVPYGQIKKYFRGNDVVINPGTPSPTTSQKTEDLQFYYHPDHLGSSNYITDVSGEVYQHQEYFPFGETFVEERNDAEYTTYLFNGKELDEETGLYYYGARYYDPRISMWYGVDQMAEKYYSFSPYVYALNNPINLMDFDGRDVLPSKFFLTTNFGKTFQNLRKNNSAFQNEIKKFENNPNYNLRLSVDNAKAAGGAITIYTYRNDVNSYFMSSSTIASNSKYEFTEIGKVTVIAHEMVHPKLAANGVNEDQDHNEYNKARQDLVNMLKEYSTDNNLNLSEDDITALSFSGQQSSNEFKKYINEQAEKNGITSEEQKKKYDSQVSHLMYKKKDDENKNN